MLQKKVRFDSLHSSKSSYKNHIPFALSNFTQYNERGGGHV